MLSERDSRDMRGFTKCAGAGFLPFRDQGTIINKGLEGFNQIWQVDSPVFSAIFTAVRDFPTNILNAIKIAFVTFAILREHALLILTNPGRKQALRPPEGGLSLDGTR